MNDFADLRAALAAVHAAEYPSDRDVAIARLGAAATPEVVAWLLADADLLARRVSTAPDRMALLIKQDALEAEVYHLHRRLAAAEQERDQTRSQHAQQAAIAAGVTDELARVRLNQPARSRQGD